MRDPDPDQADAYLRMAHAQFCEAITHLALIVAGLPNAPGNAYDAGQSIAELTRALDQAKRSYFTYIGLISGAEGEA